MKYFKCLSNGYCSWDKDVVYAANHESCINNYDYSTDVAYYADKLPQDWEEIVESKYDIGQKIVCVDSVGYLADRQVYTVRDIKLDSVGDIGLSLDECSNIDSFNIGYNQNRFRPFNVNVELNYTDLMLLDVIIDSALEQGLLSNDVRNLENKIGEQLLNHI
jgi:regulator of RNase E activity RraB